MGLLAGRQDLEETASWLDEHDKARLPENRRIKKGLDRGGMPVRDPIQGDGMSAGVRVQDASAGSPACWSAFAAARIGNTGSNQFNRCRVQRLALKNRPDRIRGSACVGWVITRTDQGLFPTNQGGFHRNPPYPKDWLSGGQSMSSGHPRALIYFLDECQA